jgi:hypothetical protein
MLRRNPTNIQTLIDFARKAGKERLADLIVRYQDDADVAPLLSKVADKVAERLAAKAARSAPAESASPMSDREGWMELAKIVPEALGRAYPDLVEPLQKAFREEASKH